MFFSLLIILGAFSIIKHAFHYVVVSLLHSPPPPWFRLASIEKFSRFSRLLETNVNTLHMACQGVTMSQRDLLTNVNLLAKDLKCFAKGVESTGGGALHLV